MADINLNINAKNNASDTIKKIASDTKGLEGQFKKLGATLAGVFAAREIFKFAKESINATRELNSFARSIASTEMALGKFGNNASWKTVLSNVNGQVDGLKKMSNQYGVIINDVLSMRKELAEPLSFLDSNTINQLLPKLAAAGATMGISVNQMANEIDAVVDGRLKEKSSVLVKSLGMDVSAVNKMGGTRFISELMSKLNSMESVFKEYAQSDEGKIAQFENQWNDFKITLGSTLIGPLTELLKSLKEPIENLKSAVQSENFKNFINIIGKAAGVAAEHPVATAAGLGAAKLGLGVAESAAGTYLMKNILDTKSIETGTKALEAYRSSKYISLLKEFFNPALLSGILQGFLAPMAIAGTIIGGAYLGAQKRQEERNEKYNKGKNDQNQNSGSDVPEKVLKGKPIIKIDNQLFGAKTIDNLQEGYESVQNYIGGNVGTVASNVPVGEKIGSKFEEDIIKLQEALMKAASQPVKVEISLKADMPYQASLSLTDSSGTQNKKIAPRVSDGRIIRG